MSNVPCDGCTLCCQGDAVRLLPGDDPAQYQIEPHPYLTGASMLAHKPNGECIYLGATGCTIHATKPQMCRELDCRVIARRLTYTQARKMNRKGMLKLPVWRRGRDLSG